VSATSDNVVYAVRRPRLNRLLELLRMRRRHRPAIGEREIDSSETGLIPDSEMYDKRSSDAEIIFISMMWAGI
jgi:hypothetical protein